MRIALDITPLFQDKPSGVAYYCASVINALQAFKPANEYLIFGICPQGLRDSVVKKLDEIAPKAQKKIIFVPQKIQQPLLEALQRMPLRLIDQWIGRVDIFHQFDSYSFASRNIVTATVFDLSALKFPHMHAHKNLSIQLNRLRVLENRSQHFFTISNTIKKELMSEWRLPSELISVAYPSIDNRQNLAPACDNFTCLKKNLDTHTVVSKGNFFLSVATREPRKNIAHLINAFKLMDNQAQKDYPLVIVGARGWGQDLGLKSHGTILTTGFVCESCLEKMYAQAHALAYVSHYEGFGMPIAEAMKAKLLVICSDIPVFREIAGKAAMFVREQSPQEIKRAMENSITLTESERTHLVGAGSLNSKRFSAKACASVMVSAWLRLVQSGHENRDL